MALIPVRVFGTVAADGTGTFVSEGVYAARLYAVQWVKGTFANGVDPTLTVIGTDGATNVTLLTLTNADASAMYYPRYLQHGETGTALTGTAGGDRTLAPVVGKLQLGIAQGGNATTGGVIVYLCE